MKNTIALAVACSLAACAPKAQTGALPAGTYQYESREGNVTADSAVDVIADSGVVIVRERVRLGSFEGPEIESRLDPKTYSFETYSTAHDPEGDDPSLSIAASEAKYTMKTGGPVIAKAPAPRAPSFVFGDWVSSFVALPSLVHATGAKTINGYVPELVHGKAKAMAFYVVGARTTVPESAPSGDSGLGLAWRRGDKPVVMLWYDPATFILDSVELGGATAFVRKQ